GLSPGGCSAGVMLEERGGRRWRVAELGLGAWGRGHGAWGMGHGAWGLGLGQETRLTTTQLTIDGATDSQTLFVLVSGPSPKPQAPCPPAPMPRCARAAFPAPQPSDPPSPPPSPPPQTGR